MGRFTPLVAVFLLFHVASLGVSQLEPQTDQDTLATLVAGVRSHEAGLPPLTMAGVHRLFSGDLHWQTMDKVLARVGAAEDAAGTVRGDRAAVAYVLCERDDAAHWQEEFRGLYRGPNSWVYPKSQADPAYVADMLRVQRCALDRLTTLDFTTGAPLVTVKARTSLEPRRSEGVAAFALGLAGHLPLAEALAAPLGGGDWRLGDIAQNGSIFVVRSGYCGPRQNDEVAERTFEIDSERSYVILRHRYVNIRGGTGGVAVEARWDDVSEVNEEIGYWPRSATRWDLDFRATGRERLVRAKQFTCGYLAPTAPDTEMSWFPLSAVFAEADSDPALVAAQEGFQRPLGSYLRFDVAAFATEQPPPPPEDMLNLDPAKAAADIKARYRLG